MKSVNEYILIAENNNILESIDNEIICEKLQEPHLLQIAKWFAKNEDKYYVSFSQYFKSFCMAFDKIKTSDFEYYQKGDKIGIKKAITACPGKNGYADILIIFLNDNDTVEAFKISSGGLIYPNIGKYQKKAPLIKGSRYDRDWSHPIDMPSDPVKIEDVKQKNIRALCDQYNFMILDISSKSPYSTTALRADRYTSHQGIITIDRYAEIARQNIERYKKIINKRKAERLIANDNISDEIESILSQVLQLSQTVVAGGAKYLNLQYILDNLFKLCYDKQTWDHRGNHHGKDGLLTIYSSYINSLLDTNKGYTYSNPNNYKKELENQIAYIKTQIQELTKRL